MNRRHFGKIAAVALGALPCLGLAAKADADAAQDNIFNVLRRRHSVRAYTEQPVSEEAIDQILRYAMMAPSAANEQPWEFVVIRERAMLEKIGAINHYASFAAKAPLAILLCLNEQKEKIRGMGILDMGICAENLMLAATGLGIGSVFTGVYPEKDRMDGFARLCKLPDYVKPIGLIVLGYPAITNHQSPDRYNKAAIHLNTW